MVDHHVNVHAGVQPTEHVPPLIGGHPDLGWKPLQRRDHPHTGNHRARRGHQRDLVARSDQPSSLQRDHPLDAAIRRRRDGDPRWGKKSDPHA